MLYEAKTISIELCPWDAYGSRGQEGPRRLVAVVPPGVGEEGERRDEHDQEGREEHFVTQMVLVPMDGWLDSDKWSS